MSSSSFSANSVMQVKIKQKKKIDGSMLLAKKFSQVCQPALELSTKCFVLQKYLKGVSL